MKFVRATDISGDVILVNLNSVEKVHREECEERASIIETADCQTYECYNEVNMCPKIRECIIEL